MDAHLNPIAIIIGLTYGTLAAAGGYYVSQLASGLFARPFYRIYARVLIGICAVMLLAPALRTVAPWPIASHLLLTVAGYAVMAILGYGVILFNRHYLAKLSVDRPVVVYFIFGTLAYAAITALVMLHVSARLDTGSDSIRQTSIVVGHYAPLLMVLSGLVFHTDNHLKRVSRSARQFSGFTFVGYAISFVAIGMSLIPYFGSVLASVGWRPHEQLLLTNFSSAQTLLLAIFIYGALVWHRDSIPPLYLMLLAICGEYFVLVTQWLIRDDALGPVATGLVSLPLVIGLDGLAHYFLVWDRKHQHQLDLQLGREGAETVAGNRPRLATPFVVISSLLAAGLIAFTIWARLATTHTIHAVAGLTVPAWLAVTMIAYAVYYLLATVWRRQPRSIYAAGGLIALAAVFGVQPIGTHWTVLWLALTSITWVVGAAVGGRFGVKSAYRTPLADSGLVTATLALALIAGRLCWDLAAVGPASLVIEDLLHYRSDTINTLSLGLIPAAFLIAGWLYGSRLPVYGALVAVTLMAIDMAAPIAMLTVFAADAIRHRLVGNKSRSADDSLRFGDRWLLPGQDSPPELFAAPLTAGTLPLAFLGLLVGLHHIQSVGLFTISPAETLHQPSWTPVIGILISALVLGLYTRRHRWAPLYVIALAAGYFGLHATAQMLVPHTAQFADMHLLVAATISLSAWLLANTYSIWCGLLIGRVAEEKEAEYDSRRAFYGGLTYQVTSLANLVVLAVMAWRVLTPSSTGNPMWIIPAGGLLAIQFALAATVFGSKLFSYLSLASVGLTTWSATQLLHLLTGTPSLQTDVGRSLVLQIVALALCLLANRWRQVRTASSEPADWVRLARPWTKSPWPLAAERSDLWLHPLVQSALVFTACALVVLGASFGQSVTGGIIAPERWLQLQIPIWSCVSLILAALTFLAGTRVYRQSVLYVVAIVTTFLAVHASAQSFGLHQLSPIAASSAHLLLLSLLSGLAWSLAGGLSSWWQALARRVSTERELEVRAAEAYYADILRQFSLVTTLLALALTGWLVVAEQTQPSAAPWTTPLAGLILAVLLAQQARRLTSSTLVYLATSAVGVAGYATVATLAPLATRHSTDGMMLAIIGLAAAATAWVSAQRTRNAPSSAMNVDPSAKSEHRELATKAIDLVPQPLSLMSVGFGALAVAHTAIGWGNVAPTWSILPLAAAAVIWWIGNELALQGRWQPLQQLAVPLYVSSVLATFTAVHATWNAAAAADARPIPMRVALHVIVQGVVLLVGWVWASVVALRLARIEPTAENQPITRRLTSRAGLLNDILLMSGVGGLIVLLALTVPWPSVSPHITLWAVGLLAVYFAGSAATYRSQIGSYLSLVTLGIGIFLGLLISGIMTPDHASSVAALLAAGGLAAMTLAATLLNPPSLDEVSGRLIRLPSPWTTPRLPLRANTWQQLWQIPVVVASTVMTIVGLLLIGPGLLMLAAFSLGFDVPPTPQMPGVLILAATTSWVAAGLFRSSKLSYVGAVILGLATYPAAALFDMTPLRVGPWLATLSIGLWLASFAVERWLKRRRTKDLISQEQSVQLAGTYERPLVRSGTVFALLAMLHSLANCADSGWSAQSGNLLMTSGLSAVTLLLAARTMQVLQFIDRARLLVYLGTLAASGCWIVAGLSWWGVRGIPWSTAGLSLALTLLGLILQERAERSDRPAVQARLRLFGLPISTVGRWVPPLAVALAIATRLDGAPWPVLAWALLATSLVYVLAVRATHRIGWLHPAVMSATAAILYTLTEMWQLPPALVMFSSIVLMHGLLTAGWIVRRRRAHVGSMLGVGDVECERAFHEWPLVVGVASTVALFAPLLVKLTGQSIAMEPVWPWPATSALTVWLLLRIAKMQWHNLLPHLAITASLGGLFLIADQTRPTISADVVLLLGGLLWGGIASTAVRPSATPSWLARSLVGTDSVSKFAVAALFWATALCALAALVTVPCSILRSSPYPTSSIVWLAVSIACAWWGYRWHQGPVPGAEVDLTALVPKDFDWLRASVVAETLASLLLLLSVTAGLWYTNGSPDFGQAASLQTWASQTGLAATILAAIFLWLTGRLRHSTHPQPQTASFLQQTAGALSGVGLLAVIVATALVVPSMALHTAGPAVNLALLVACWTYLAWTNQAEPAVYVAQIAAASLALYVRYQLLDSSWGRAYDSSFGVVAASFLAFGVYSFLMNQSNQRLQLFRRPMIAFAILAPLALLLTTPLEWHDWRVSMVIFGTGALYSVIAHWSQYPRAEYVAAALYNLGIYLWIPTASGTFHLLQLYVIPAAFTVLVLAQLHRHELNHRALTSIRLAAASAILAVSTFDALFSSSTQNLPQFVLVLTLSLLSIGVGIATYVRPFVFAGVAFLIVNVLGQLGLQFHLTRDGALRAAILIGLGLVVIALMIYFNIRREQILKKYHYFLTDPRWE